MFNKIYTPIDNSDISDKVLNEAIDLSKSVGASLRVVHAVNLEQITFGIEMLGVAEFKKVLLDVANQLVDHVKDLLKAKNMLDVEVVILENYGSDITSLILEDAKAWGADLFVLGSHSLGSLSHFITGGMAEDLSHECDIPILLISKHKK